MKNKIYIYPKGRNGLALQEVRRFLGEEEADFMDDSDSARSLDQLSKQIKEEGATVLIASNWLHDQLKDKLQSQGITQVENGVKLYGERLNDYLKSQWGIDLHQRAKEAPPPLVGYILGGFAKEKHLGDIDQHLLKMGAQVVYICLSQEALEKNRDRVAKHPHLVANHDLVAELRLPLIIGSKTFRSNKTTLGVYTGHACCGLLMYLGQEKLQFQEITDILMKNYKILVAPIRRVAKFYEQIKKKYSNGPIVVSLGYPSLDLQIQEYEKFAAENRDIISDSIIIAMHIESETLKEIIGEILNLGLKVIFRPHPIEREKESIRAIKDFYKNHPSVHIDETSVLSSQFLAQSVTLIVDRSSLAYSYPFTVLRPAILFDCQDKIEKQGKGESRITFFDEELHILCKNAKEVSVAITHIKREGHGWRERIDSYRKEEVLNFSDSSRAIARFLIDVLEGKA